ncbi:MAG: hypothetical protein F6J93_38175 [Oscillatoria sp. SIO1A7]|nr:hypothetical protein [Oscillatoria sp. SIO1A7]
MSKPTFVAKEESKYTICKICAGDRKPLVYVVAAMELPFVNPDKGVVVVPSNVKMPTRFDQAAIARLAQHCAGVPWFGIYGSVFGHEGARLIWGQVEQSDFVSLKIDSDSSLPLKVEIIPRVESEGEIVFNLIKVEGAPPSDPSWANLSEVKIFHLGYEMGAVVDSNSPQAIAWAFNLCSRNLVPWLALYDRGLGNALVVWSNVMPMPGMQQIEVGDRISFDSRDSNWRNA